MPQKNGNSGLRKEMEYQCEQLNSFSLRSNLRRIEYFVAYRERRSQKDDAYKPQNSPRAYDPYVAYLCHIDSSGPTTARGTLHTWQSAFFARASISAEYSEQSKRRQV